MQKNDLGNDKEGRQRELLGLIQNESIDTQEDLVRAIRKRGYPVTQTTMSRDLSELQVVKVSGAYRPLSGGVLNPIERAFAEHAKSVAPVGDHLIVLKTQTGSAQTVAIEIDRAEWKEIVGTIAGDDTILVILKSGKDVTSVAKRFARFIQAHPA